LALRPRAFAFRQVWSHLLTRRTRARPNNAAPRQPTRAPLAFSMTTTPFAVRLLRRLRAPIASAALCAASLAAIAATPRPAPPPAAPQGAGVTVLVYHEVVTDNRTEGKTTITAEHFAEQMELLSDEGFVTVGIGDLVRHMKGEATLPPKAVVLTFEDGWRSVLNATPVLDRYKQKASFWIITGNGIGGLYLDWSDIERLAANPRYEVYSHTVSHPWDPNNNLVTWVQGPAKEEGKRDALNELTESKRVLEQRLGKPVPYLAWPSGWYDDTLVGLAKEAGYSALLTTEPGLNRRGDDVLRIHRTIVDGGCDLLTFRRTVETGSAFTCQQRQRVP
jgi:peptidoglycan/xylan/chitin deacetylase (PgdA/CDA1 family)